MSNTNNKPNGTPNVPNLDCLETDELFDYWKAHKGAEASTPEAQLAEYAFNKAQAQQYRLAGEIGNAMTRETACDAIYDKLPSDYRW